MDDRASMSVAPPSSPEDHGSSADRLRAFRDRHGYSQARAAEITGTPKRTWEGWETERREPPTCLWVLLRYIDRWGLLSSAATPKKEQDLG